LSSALASAVIATDATPSAEGFTGLSIHFPQPGRSVGVGYDRLGSGGAWLRMLTAFATQSSAAGPQGRARFAASSTVVTSGSDGSVQINGQLDTSTGVAALATPTTGPTSPTSATSATSAPVAPTTGPSTTGPSTTGAGTGSNNVVDARLDVGLRTGPTSALELAGSIFAVDPSSISIAALWDRRVLTVVAGDRDVDVHFTTDVRRGPLSAAYIPFSLQEGSTTTHVLAQVVFDRPKREVTGLRWYSQDLMGAWTELMAGPGAAALPRMAQRTGTSDVQWTDSAVQVAAGSPIAWRFRTVTEQAVARLTVVGLRGRDSVAVQIP
jgi:hypothetical protein